MSLRYKGGVISATPPTPSASAATGVWTLEQQLQAEAAGNWPSQPPAFGESMRSLRFNSADSASLTRTFPSAGNRKTWTWSGWLKRTALSDTYGGALFICSSGSTDSTYSVLWFYANAIRFQAYNTLWRVTSAVYRDLSAWYHVVLAVDTTQATANNRIKLYVNGSQVTDFSTTNNPNQNDDLYINSANLHRIGEGDSIYSNMYLAEVVFVDGQALTPSSFGQTNSTTGVWEPKAITGLTYGTNGFYLNFQDNSGTTATTLGKDSSGNGNNWTPNNFSVTAGIGNDSLVDTPYPYGTDTGAGGTVRGNYCTFNPLDKSSSVVLANGNLDVTFSGSQGTVRSTLAFPTSGKYYSEFRMVIASGAYGYPSVGIAASTQNLSNDVGTVCYIRPRGGDGDRPYFVINSTDLFAKVNNTPLVNGDIISVIYDADNSKVWMGVNGTWYGLSGSTAVTVSGTDIANGTNPAYTLTANTTYLLTAYGAPDGSPAVQLNAGQRAFAYTAPSGFKALCTQNLPTPTTVQPDDYFNTVLYTGNGSTQSVTGLDFQPDFVWIKARSIAYEHMLFDVNRGTTNYLNTNNTLAQQTFSGSLTAFNANGFSLGNGNAVNQNSQTFVAWNWKGGGSAVSNTQGTISSTVSANTTAGFSVVTYTGNGIAGATIGHGLNAVPNMIIVKTRNAEGNGWRVYHVSLGATHYILLNSTDRAYTYSDWNSTTPTSTVFTVGAGSPAVTNTNGNTYVAYCFAPVAGFSTFGSYTGNGSTNGPFIYTGFKPAFVLQKASSSAETYGNWHTYDNKRDTYNPVDKELYPNLDIVEGNIPGGDLDFLSNGFKIRTDFSGGWNTNGVTYIYAAFAENPFKYALAR